MIYFPTLISIIEVLLVTVPVLLTVAYVTVAERKTMASMQRRLGPNAVGYLGLLQALKGKNIIRHYHTTNRLYNLNDTPNKVKCKAEAVHLEAIKELYRDRVAPVKIFDNDLIATCSNFLDLKERSLFLQDLEDKGGIYLIQYKYDLNIYYIGRTKKYSNRFRSHIKHKLTDRFHVFANIVGWDSFKFSIVEICSHEEQGMKENAYLQEYLPLLNTNFVSNYTESKVYTSLWDILELNRSEDVLNNNGIIPVYVYKYSNSNLDKTYVLYNSINKANEDTKVSRVTIKRYINTNVPIKNLLFYSKPVDNFVSTNELIKNTSKGFNLYSSSPKEVWVYSLPVTHTANLNEPVKELKVQYFISRAKVCEYLNVSYKNINSYVDNWKPGGLQGYYLFNQPLNEKEVQDLIELISIKVPEHKTKVWAYEAKTLKLINNSPFDSMNKTGDYFNVDYRSISSNLDTKLAVNKNGMWVYFFTAELSVTVRDELLNNLTLAKNVTTAVWVYKKEG